MNTYQYYAISFFVVISLIFIGNSIFSSNGLEDSTCHEISLSMEEASEKFLIKSEFREEDHYYYDLYLQVKEGSSSSERSGVPARSLDDLNFDIVEGSVTSDTRNGTVIFTWEVVRNQTTCKILTGYKSGDSFLIMSIEEIL